MANPNAPYGLRPINADGRPYSGGVNEYYVPSTDTTALFVGDPVKLAGSADADGVPTVVLAAAGDPIVGVVVARSRTLRDDTVHRPAAAASYLLVADDPNIAFVAQEDSDAGAIAATAVGLNVNLIAGAGGSTAFGTSSYMIDSSSANTTNTLDFQLVRLARIPGNEIGNYAQWIIRPNTHHRAFGTTGL